MMGQDSLGASLPQSDRTRHRRLAEQGSYDREELNKILQSAFICHLGLLLDGAPIVVPTVFGADRETLFFHGSVASRSLLSAPQAPVCITITIVDALVLARSVFEHGVNYRSAMVFGTPCLVTDVDEKNRGLALLTENAAPGQWNYAREPNRKELAATTLLAVSLAEAAVKLRTGFADDHADIALPVWSGVLPLVSTWGQPVRDMSGAPREDVDLPAHLAALVGRRPGPVAG